MARGPDAGALVERALGQSATRAGLTIEIVEASAERWASATFTGARHVLSLRMDDLPGVREWLDTLSEANLPIRNHLVADCAVVRQSRCDGRIDARVEALTVETA